MSGQHHPGHIGSFALAVAVAAVFGAAIVIQSQKRRERLKLPKKSDSENIQTNKLRRTSSKGVGSLSAYESLIGSTPLVQLKKLSSILDRSIYVKMECLNPGGTGKDRAALAMIQDAERRGMLPTPASEVCVGDTATGDALNGDRKGKETSDASNPHPPEARNTRATNGMPPTNNTDPIENSITHALSRSRTGGVIVEGTSGSTGISLSTLAASRGHGCIIVMPDDQASEKRAILKCLGAAVHVVKNCAISNPSHYVNMARRIAQLANGRSVKISGGQYGGGGIVKAKVAFMNQFENTANYDSHWNTTGPEIWNQTSGKIDGFVMSSGTGGTIAGAGAYLKQQTCGKCRVVLVDPPGSALYNKVKFGVAYAEEQRERNMKRHRYDTLAEGIGLDRVTANFALGVDATDRHGGGRVCGGVIDDAVRVSDQEAVDMAHWLLREEGLFVGSSSAMNLVGAVKVASGMEAESRIVTIICDGGQRHLTRFWSPDFVRDWGLVWPSDRSGGDAKLPQCISDMLCEEKLQDSTTNNALL